MTDIREQIERIREGDFSNLNNTADTMERMLAVVEAAKAHRDNDEFFNVPTWQALVKALAALDEEK
jgi:hypothetical protein